MDQVHLPRLLAVILVVAATAVPARAAMTTLPPPPAVTTTAVEDASPGAPPEVRDHCAVDVFDHAPIPQPGELHFTKELNVVEYVVTGHFKSLHCCARGYSSIEWFKDGVAYPWATAVSNFILYPEAANQTVYSKRTGTPDAGNYTCVARNDTHSYNHTVELKVIDAESYMGLPLPTYKLPDEQFIAIGQPARLFCEAFVGSIDLPDAESEIIWRRLGRNDSFIGERKRFSQRRVFRVNNQVLGSYLTIDSVQSEDLGLYECRISNAGDQITQLNMWLREARYGRDEFDRPKAWRMLAIIGGIVMFAVVTATILRNRLAVVFLHFRNKVVLTDQYDGKDFDVLLAYLSQDENFASEVTSTLQHSYGYQCLKFEIPAAPMCEWEAELRSAANRCRRLLVIIQPSLVDHVVALPMHLQHVEQFDGEGFARWHKDSVTLLTHQVAALHPSVVCISLQALPHGYGDRDDIAARLPVPVIEWNSKRSLSFKNWHQLRLRLPPRSSKHPGGPGPKGSGGGSANTVCSVAVSRARGSDSGGNVVTSVVDRAGNCGKRRSNSSFLDKNDSLEILV